MTDDPERRDRFDPRTSSGIRRSTIVFWVFVIGVVVVLVWFIWARRNHPARGAAAAPDSSAVIDTTMP